MDRLCSIVGRLQELLLKSKRREIGERWRRGVEEGLLVPDDTNLWTVTPIENRYAVLDGCMTTAEPNSHTPKHKLNLMLTPLTSLRIRSLPHCLFIPPLLDLASYHQPNNNKKNAIPKEHRKGNACPGV